MTPASLILIVDDNLDCCRVYEHGIARDLPNVGVLSDGAAALDVVRRERVAVVVADQRMPGMAGTDLLRRAREESPCTVGVLVTAFDVTAEIETALGDGTASDLLLKPVAPERLREAIETAAARHREIVEARDECDRCTHVAEGELLEVADRMEAAVASAERAAERLCND